MLINFAERNGFHHVADREGVADRIAFGGRRVADDAIFTFEADNNTGEID
jgi:hypothetical protein